MKIRNGFVSNSSSSSFIVLCKRIYFEDIDKDKLDGVYVYGHDLGEGYDIFPLAKNMFDFLKRHYANVDDSDISFYRVYWINGTDSPEQYMNFDRATWNNIGKNLPENEHVELRNWEISYHITSNLQRFREDYFPDIIDEEEQREKEMEEFCKFSDEVKKETEKLERMKEELKARKKELKIKED